MRGEKDKGKRVTAKMPFKTIYHMEKRIYLKPNKSPKNINITPTIYVPPTTKPHGPKKQS